MPNWLKMHLHWWRHPTHTIYHERLYYGINLRFLRWVKIPTPVYRWQCIKCGKCCGM